MFVYVVAAQVMCFRLQTWLASLAIAKKKHVCLSKWHKFDKRLYKTDKFCLHRRGEHHWPKCKKKQDVFRDGNGTDAG